ncbi:MAG: hypothetical protein PHV68_08250 [Candidatus Gastranaerophilales bacterium]|nr:hypothetical protein [Candidatus Gastranaerophilales bacterium]
MNIIEKVEKARELLLEAEDDLIIEKGFCLYELGFTIKNIEETIKVLKKEN